MTTPDQDKSENTSEMLQTVIIPLGSTHTPEYVVLQNNITARIGQKAYFDDVFHIACLGIIAYINAPTFDEEVFGNIAWDYFTHMVPEKRNNRSFREIRTSHDTVAIYHQLRTTLREGFHGEFYFKHEWEISGFILHFMQTNQDYLPLCVNQYINKINREQLSVYFTPEMSALLSHMCKEEADFPQLLTEALLLFNRHESELANVDLNLSLQSALSNICQQRHLIVSRMNEGRKVAHISKRDKEQILAITQHFNINLNEVIKLLLITAAIYETERQAEIGNRDGC